MKRFTAVILALAVVLIASGAVFAAEEVDISGELKSDLVGNPDNGYLTDTETFNLQLEKKFGFDADMYLDLGFKSYTQNQAVIPTGDGQVELKELPEAQRKTDVNIEEAYINYYTENVDWRLGKQEINWGSAYKLQPTNYFNPRDLTALKPLDEKKGVKAVKGVYYAPARIEVSGVVTPFFATHEMSQQRKLTMVNNIEAETANNILGKTETLDENIEELNSVLSSHGLELNKFNTDQDTISSNWITEEVESVNDEVENMQGGFKITKRSFKGFDLSASVYRGRDKQPILDRETIEEKLGVYKKSLSEIEKKLKEEKDVTKEVEELNQAIAQADNLNLPLLIYPKTNRVGFDVIGDIGDMGVWTEVVYSMYEDDQFDDRVKAAAGVDYKFDNDLYLVGQTYYQQGRIDSESDIKAVNLHFDKPVFDFHEIKMNAIYEVESETYMIEPQFNYSLANSTVLQLGGTYLESDDEEGSNLISSLGDDRVYARLKVEF